MSSWLPLVIGVPFGLLVLIGFVKKWERFWLFWSLGGMVSAYLSLQSGDIDAVVVFIVLGVAFLLWSFFNRNRETIIEPPSRPLFSGKHVNPVVTVLARSALSGLVVTYGSGTDNAAPRKTDPADLLMLRVKDIGGWEMDKVLAVIVPRNVCRFRLEWEGDQKNLYLINSATAQRYCGSVIIKQQYETVSFTC